MQSEAHSFFSALSKLRDVVGRCAAPLGRIERHWASGGLALATLLGFGAYHGFHEQPEVAIVPLAEPHRSGDHGPAAAPASGAAWFARDSSCPQEIYPKLPLFDPAATDPDVRRAGVTVHTFQQETRSCGPILRRYLEYVPEGARPRSRAPVVLILHGGADRAEGMRQIQTRGRFEALARRDGFIAVYASAVPSADSDPVIPNVGRWQLTGELERQVDDLGYLERVTRDMQRRGVIAGDNRILLVGHGEGASMALHAAAQRPDLYSGVAALMPDAVMAAPKLDADALLRRVLFVSPDNSMSAVVHDWALSLGISHKAIEKALPLVLADRASEGHDFSGDVAIPQSSRSSRVTRFDIETSEADGPKIRALFVSANAGQFVPMPEADRPELVMDFGFRNQDIDSAEAAWEFLRGALDG
jgi:pimeloyl-ACP methyl ester carboxylesterase